MQRRALSYLMDNWLLESDRKPLVIRGARQVGKTWLVREFAKVAQKTLIELNIEKEPKIFEMFDSNDPKMILLQLSAKLRKPIDVATSLLFLDEIQAAPELLAKLRWFAEDMPELPVIAAGSLLEFVLASHTFSMPVGRINYLHLEPLTFEEFLLAHNDKTSCDYLQQIDFSSKIPAILHDQLLNQFKNYMIVGGLPASVSKWIEKQEWSSVHRVHQDLLATYRDDFSKYHGRLSVERLEETLSFVPKALGKKFIYSHVNSEAQSSAIKNALNLLQKARLCHAVRCVHANGIPMAAEIKEGYFKEILLDVGLCLAMLGLDLQEIIHAKELTLIHSGGMAEQVTGQLLRTVIPFYVEPALYYWARDEKNANAEIDYVIQHRSSIIPIEVKAGATGSLKSLHYFMELKKLSLALRINSDIPSKTAVSTKQPGKNLYDYTLLSIPFYLIEQIPRLLQFVKH